MVTQICEPLFLVIAFQRDARYLLLMNYSLWTPPFWGWILNFELCGKKGGKLLEDHF